MTASTTSSSTPNQDVRERWGAPRCGYTSNVLMLWLGRRALWLGYALVWFAALYFLVLVPRARRASMAYLDRIWPGRSRLRRWWDTYRHLVTFGFLLLDRAIMLTTKAHGFAIRAEGVEHMARAAQNPRGVILLTAHFGNAEIGAPYIRDMNVTQPINIVMYHVSGDATERFHAQHRTMMKDMAIISTTDPLAAGIKIIAALKRGEIVAMRADRTLSGKSLPATLLGGPVELPAGPFTTAVLSGAPVISVYSARLGYRNYMCVLSPVRVYTPANGETRVALMARAAQDYANDLETILRRFPLQWSNFYDFWGQPSGPSSSNSKVEATTPAA